MTVGRHRRDAGRSAPAQKPFFLLFSKLTVRYRYRGGFLGSFTIGVRAAVGEGLQEKPLVAFLNVSILTGFFGIRCDPNSIRFRSAPPLSGLVLNFLQGSLQWAPANLAKVPLNIRHQLLAARRAVNGDVRPSQIAVRFAKAGVADIGCFGSHVWIRAVAETRCK